jgi:hypothetical protein
MLLLLKLSKNLGLETHSSGDLKISKGQEITEISRHILQ